MVAAWFMDDSDADQRLPHKREPHEPVSLEYLRNLGVLYFYFEVDDDKSYTQEDSAFNQLKKERGYTFEDTITITREKLPNYDEKIKNFFTEHLHTDEEIRFILDGSGYFDVRDSNERWIRIALTKGDLIILPAGIYHRFTLDTNDMIVANRLFVGEPVWTPHNRPADDMECRRKYLTTLPTAA